MKKLFSLNSGKKVIESDKRLLSFVAVVLISIILLGFVTFLLIAPKTDFVKFFCNFLIVLILFGFSLMIFHRYSIAFTFVNAVMVFFYYLNQYVFHSRLVQIQFNDVYCIGDAMNMASGYPLVFNAEIFLHIALVVLICVGYVVLLRRLFKSVDSSPFFYNFLTGVAVILLSLFELLFAQLPKDQMHFGLNNYTDENGLFYSWYTEFTESFVDIPNNYSSEYADSLLKEYITNSVQSDGNVNIVVIMNEALTDYSLIGDIGLSRDPLGNIHSMNENCIKGRLGVNVYGGYTSNSEFEFLTGYSTAFLPQSSVPYIQYINDYMGNLTTDMNSLGYVSSVIHPYFAQEYRRPYVYSYFGFDDYVSGEDFSDIEVDVWYSDIANIVKANFGSDLEYIRGFVSDRECYNRVIDTLTKDNSEGKSSFVFNITIQNHGGYETEKFDTINFLEGDYAPENEYLTSIYYSDIAFKEFIDTLQSYPEKTIVLMFGDHQPALPKITNVITSYSEGNYYGTIADKYTVPYIMWANYDVDWKDRGDLSINYLSAVLKENAGLPLSAWDIFRLEVAEKYPVLTSNYIVDSKGNYLSLDFVKNEKLLEDYEIIQYRNIFD